MDSTFSRTEPATQKSLSECGRNSGGSFFVLFCFVFNFGTVDLAVSKEATTKQALPPALFLGVRRPEFLFRPSVQTDNPPSKVNYTWYWIFAHGDSYHLTTEEGIIPTHRRAPLNYGTIR
uniref:Uncharacterized protein n=1 Tax=Sciurus vulgaris TaxID=55149 RepID=A0A8D2B8G5_SCIVU